MYFDYIVVVSCFFFLVELPECPYKLFTWGKSITNVITYTLQKKKRNMWKNIIYFKFSTSV